MDSFQTRLKVKTIRADLLALPKGLDAYDTAYDDAMTRIFGQERDYQESAAKLLSLILCARRPLTSHELQHALMIETGDMELDPDNSLDPETMLSVCAGLITIDESSDTIRFVHYTTQEYLQRTQERWIPNAEFKIARACLDYLLLHEFSLATDDSEEDTDSERSDSSSINLSNGHDEVTGTDDSYMYRFNNEHGPDDSAKNIRRRKFEFPFAKYAIRHGPYHWDAVITTQTSTHADILSLLLSSPILSTMRQMFHPYPYPDDSFPGTNLDAVVNWFSQLCLANLTEFCLVNGWTCETNGPCSGLSPLNYAAAHGHEPLVRLLLGHNADIENSSDQWSQTPLMQAAMGGHESIVQLLLQNNASVDQKDSGGSTALTRAATRGSESIVRALLPYSTNLDPVDVFGCTPLLLASKNGHGSVVELLIRNGAAVDVRDEDGMTPLAHAAKAGYGHVLRILHKYEAEVDSKDDCEMTPLAHAVTEGHDSVAQTLVKYGARVDYEYSLEVSSSLHGPRTLLSHAAESGLEGTTRLLLEHCVAVDARAKSGRTPLSFAVCRPSEGAARVLVEYGAAIDLQDNNNRTPLSHASEHGCSNTTKLLLEHGADVNAKDDSAHTPLSYAVNCFGDEIVRTLLDRGALIDEKDRNGRTPLSYAVCSFCPDATRLLLQEGAFVNSEDSNGRMPLWHAATYNFNNDAEAARLLIEYGAIIDAEDRSGRTALSRAAAEDHKPTIELLLSKGANPNTTDEFGRTPLCHAVMSMRIDIVRLLCKMEGINVDTIDSYGRTPLSYATDRVRCAQNLELWELEEIADLLLDTGRVDASILDDYWIERRHVYMDKRARERRTTASQHATPPPDTPPTLPPTQDQSLPSPSASSQSDQVPFDPTTTDHCSSPTSSPQ